MGPSRRLALRANWQAVAENEDRTRPLPGLADWERDLASLIATNFERIEPDELEAELRKTIIELKAGSLTHVQHWGKYLTTALHRRAINWKRDRRAVAKRELTLSEPDSETSLFFSSKEDDLDNQLVMAQFREALGPELRKVLDVLEKHNFNQVKAAQELGIHRNTLRARLREIKQIAQESRCVRALKSGSFVRRANPMRLLYRPVF